MLPAKSTLMNDLFPRLGIAEKINVKAAARGKDATGMVAAGGADLAVMPISEILHAPGVTMHDLSRLGTSLAAAGGLATCGRASRFRTIDVGVVNSGAGRRRRVLRWLRRPFAVEHKPQQLDGG